MRATEDHLPRPIPLLGKEGPQQMAKDHLGPYSCWRWHQVGTHLSGQAVTLAEVP